MGAVEKEKGNIEHKWYPLKMLLEIYFSFYVCCKFLKRNKIKQTYKRKSQSTQTKCVIEDWRRKNGYYECMCQCAHLQCHCVSMNNIQNFAVCRKKK